MKRLSRGRRRRRGPRSASKGGPGPAGSTRRPAEKVSCPLAPKRDTGSKNAMVVMCDGEAWPHIV